VLDRPVDKLGHRLHGCLYDLIDEDWLAPIGVDIDLAVRAVQLVRHLVPASERGHDLVADLPNLEPPNPARLVSDPFSAQILLGDGQPVLVPGHDGRQHGDHFGHIGLAGKWSGDRNLPGAHLSGRS
jgi:hypothetical protein